MKRRLTFYVILLGTFGAVMYGATYQQFRYFDINDSRVGWDPKDYIRMSHGDYDVTAVRKYRVVVPFLAEHVRELLKPFVTDRKELEKLSFYIVNVAFGLASSLLFFELLRWMGFEIGLSIFGAFIFIANRVTVQVTGIPLVDSFFFTSLLLILLLTVKERNRWLAFALPILALSKETVLPFLLLPLLTRTRRSIFYIISLLVSFGLVYLVRCTISQRSSTESASVYVVFQSHMYAFWDNVNRLLTLEGLHDLQNGYSLFLVFAVFGFYIHSKEKRYRVPHFFLLLVPISLFLAFVSGDLGRMFFASFPVVIPYSLILISYACEEMSRE